MNRFNLQDASLILALALSNGAGTVTSGAIDTGDLTKNAVQPGDMEYVLTAPALTTAQLANAATMTYNIITSANANLSSPTVLIPGAIVQTGAGGTGAAAATYTFRLPPEAQEFVGFQAVNSGSGNCSGASATLTPNF